MCTNSEQFFFVPPKSVLRETHETQKALGLSNSPLALLCPLDHGSFGSPGYSGSIEIYLSMAIVVLAPSFNTTSQNYCLKFLNLGVLIALSRQKHFAQNANFKRNKKWKK